MTKLLVLTSTFPATKGDSTPQFVLDLIERTPDLERCVVVTPRVPGGAREEFIGDVEVRRFDDAPGGDECFLTKFTLGVGEVQRFENDRHEATIVGSRSRVKIKTSSTTPFVHSH